MKCLGLEEWQLLGVKGRKQQETLEAEIRNNSKSEEGIEEKETKVDSWHVEITAIGS